MIPPPHTHTPLSFHTLTAQVFMARSFEIGLIVFGREKSGDMQTLFAPKWPWAHTTSIHYCIKGALAPSLPRSRFRSLLLNCTTSTGDPRLGKVNKWPSLLKHKNGIISLLSFRFSLFLFFFFFASLHPLISPLPLLQWPYSNTFLHHKNGSD